MTTKGSDMYIKDMLDFTEPPISNEKSEIAEFFAHTNVLVTGGTGFLGKLLIEKLLRSCPDISKLYMIIRFKKGKTALERFKENFDDVIYDRLKREQPYFMNKVVMLEGDAGKEDYGLSSENKNILMDVNVIFHVAAIVRFDVKIRIVTNINVRSTKFLLTFAKQLPNFKAFVHVSTAFAHCIHKAINEVHYKDIIDVDKFLTLIDIMDDEKLEQITSILLDKWPNTYVYTKALAENAVLKYSEGLPVCIVRPSIVVSTYQEPIVAWTNNLYGATGVIIGSGIGLLRTLHCVPENVAEIIPADYVVSNIIASAWDIAKRKDTIHSVQTSTIPQEEKVPIYNSVSSPQNPITWDKFLKENAISGIGMISSKVLWKHVLILNRYLFFHNICVFFLHIIPAVIVDTLASLSGRKPTLLDAYKKIHKFSNVIHYFSSQQWRFRNDNVVKLWQNMNSTDQKTFCFNIETLNWSEFCQVQIRGLRLYLLNESFDTLPEAQAKYKKFCIAHYTIITVISLLLLWILLYLINFSWSFSPLSHQ